MASVIMQIEVHHVSQAAKECGSVRKKNERMISTSSAVGFKNGVLTEDKRGVVDDGMI